MCFSATASFTAAAVLVPAGIVGAQRAYRTDRRYVPVCALPLLFGIQQLLEGMVWTAGARQDDSLIEIFSLAYMFFAWLAWPVGIPVSAYFVEPDRRKPLYLGFAIAGAILGAAQYISHIWPIKAGWLQASSIMPSAMEGLNSWTSS